MHSGTLRGLEDCRFPLSPKMTLLPAPCQQSDLASLAERGGRFTKNVMVRRLAVLLRLELTDDLGCLGTLL